MSDTPTQDADAPAPPRVAARGDRREYVVVARRYRPQKFAELVGQQQVAQALIKAIATQRVGHAYLFTGARGVGKTSAARIFAKALNCQTGPTETPCDQCDSCSAIASGEDMDVLEIDGASNRGIDEIRQMRANVNIRPSRSRFKIYIIDEVHMLTLQAFNALLKTLEEPPEHVKFIFCTTDPNKLPITVLSRCQRFDFAGIQTDSICERLGQIVKAEGATADADALRLLARRAAGSMRDSQSLLEQLLAFGSERITVDDVHAMLGTARGGQLAELARCLIQRDAAAALSRFDEAIQGGVDAGQLVEQLLGYFRDMMAVRVGCDVETLLYSTPDDFEELKTAGEQLGLTTVLAVQQLLDQTLTRIRQSLHVRTLAELALVRICQLENLDDLSRWIAYLKQGNPGGPPATAANHPQPPAAGIPRPSPAPVVADRPAPHRTTSEAKSQVSNGLPAQPPESGRTTTSVHSPQSAYDSGLQPPKPTPEPSPGPQAADPGPQPAAVEPLTQENARRVWDEVLAGMGDMTAEFASRYSRSAISAPNTLEITFSSKYTSSKSFCERPDRLRQLEEAVKAAVGGPVRLVFRVEATPSAAVDRPQVRQSQRELVRQAASHPIVRQAMELFDAHVNRVDPPRNPPPDAD